MKKVIALVFMVMGLMPATLAFADSCPSSHAQSVSHIIFTCAWAGAPHKPDPYLGKPYPFDSRDDEVIRHPIPPGEGGPRLVTWIGNNASTSDEVAAPVLAIAEEATSTDATTTPDVATSNDEQVKALMAVLVDLLNQIIHFYATHPIVTGDSVVQ